jgi:hypothetical protein
MKLLRHPHIFGQILGDPDASIGDSLYRTRPCRNSRSTSTVRHGLRR